MIYDLRNNLVHGVSVKPGSTNDVTGAGVDMNNTDATVHAIFTLGDATGSPTSYAQAYKLQESDTSGGTYTDIPGATASLADAVPGTNNGNVTVIRTALRSKRWVRAFVDVTITGGSTPTVPVTVTIHGLKKVL